MGLFTGLLTLPLAPVRGVVWVAEQVTEEAERQLYDEDRIQGELLQLELDAEDGKIDEEERRFMEDELLERLAVSRARRAQAWDEQQAWDEPQASPEPQASSEPDPQPTSDFSNTRDRAVSREERTDG